MEYESVGEQSKAKAADMWRLLVLSDKRVEVEEFPTVNSWWWPIGTKGKFISPEEALRFMKTIKIPGREYEKARKKFNGHIIGEGIVAPPPCSGPAGCFVIDDNRDPSSEGFAANMKTLSLAAVFTACARLLREDTAANTCGDCKAASCSSCGGGSCAQVGHSPGSRAIPGALNAVAARKRRIQKHRAELAAAFLSATGDRATTVL